MLRFFITLTIAIAVIYFILRQDKNKSNATDEPLLSAIDPEESQLKPASHKPIKKPAPPPPKQLELEQALPHPCVEIEWTLPLLMALEWKRYEQLCQRWLVINGHHAQLTSDGADGGIDIKIFNNEGQLCGIAQCKAWQQRVGVSALREFYGVMASEGIGQGYYFTTSQFTPEAILFSNGKPLLLITGTYLVRRLNALALEPKYDLYQFATHGDYTTPSCPSCAIKMVKRHSQAGDFWGCAHYPRCKNTLKVRQTVALQ